ncbi:MAG: hypothetical protein HC895_22335 [Leptolyngbyaceae cyanobacterium SM1_3_5]|nr:hypothetical protein [Leptolyngbyaceae cyanobacterium SM1_3_5]
MISISLCKIYRFLGFAILGLTIANLTVQIARFSLLLDRQSSIYRLLNVNNEANIPTWYSTVALLVCVLLLGLIAILKQQQKDRLTNHWRGLALLFLFLSIDEAVSLHEKLNPLMRSLLNVNENLLFLWVIPGVVFVGAIALIYWRFLTRLPPQMRNLIFFSAALYLSGAIGFELVTGLAVRNISGLHPLILVLIVAIEELLEMLGILIFIRSLLLYLGDNFPAISIHFAQKD